MIAVQSSRRVEAAEDGGVETTKERFARSPTTGRQVAVRYVMRHPQFAGTIVQDLESGIQFVRAPPFLPSLPPFGV